MADGEEMEVHLAYSEGGINYFTYKTEQRGFYVHMTPVKVERHSGYKTTSRKLMDDRGRKVLVEEAKRRNKKRGAAIAAMLDFADIADAAMSQEWQEVVNLVQRDMTTITIAAE